ncbi:MAG: Smr/MutS family protein [Mailhella sp.]|nr:Smr/MutS family protein [Mailhella sp.]
MDERSFRALEFDRVLKALADLCHSEAGRQAALSLRPLDSPAEILHRQHLYEEARSWLAEADRPALSFPDLSGAMRYLGDHASPLLDLEALWMFRETLLLARRIADGIHEGASRRPLLDALACGSPLPERSLSALLRCVSDDALLKDDSSPGLLLVRGELRSIHQSCLHKVRDYAEKYNIAHCLRDEYMTLSSDRYVLPVKSNFKGRLQGIIHDYSGTGETLYFEPLFLIEQNNRLQELKRQERDEEQKVLRMISSLLSQELPLIRSAWGLLVELDRLQSCCALGTELDGRCVAMEEGNGVHLPGARHPLLVLDAARRKGGAPRRVEPVDIFFREGDRALIISGGNAGGKTVALKTLGVITLMTLSGLPAPAGHGARLPFWNDVLAFIGDEQSLDDHVSTFTGQIRHLAEAWDGLGSHALALLDEFGSGTDPAQGAALAQAVLDGLIGKGVTTVAATHFPALKSYALTREGVRAASMLFDPATRKPLFRIAYDQVGASRALDVAREHGLPASVLALAEQYLLMDGSGEERIMDRLNDLARQREAELDRLRAQEKQLEERRKALQEKMEKSRALLEEDLRRMSLELMQEYKKGRLTARQAQKDLARLRARITPGPEAGTDGPPPAPEMFTVGSEATHKLWNKKVVVRQVDAKNGKIKIDMGGVTLWAKTADLEPGGSAPPQQKVSASAKISDPGSMLSLDLRGMRADLALMELERFLDRALMSGMDGADIIHGRGTGARRRAIHGSLGTFPFVASFHPAPEDQGGDGVTQVVFR